LVFCNINYYYIEDLKKEILAANKDILLIFIQSYFENNKKITPKPMENKNFLF